MAAKTKTLLQRSQRCHKGEFRQASVLDSDHDDGERIFVGLSWELDCWWKLDRAFEQWWRSTKVLRTPPTWWVSARLLYDLVNAQRRLLWCSQNHRTPFLLAVRFEFLIIYITRHNFSPTRSVIIIHSTPCNHLNNETPVSCYAILRTLSTTPAVQELKQTGPQ